MDQKTASLMQHITILMAEDDEDDRLLTEEALKESRLCNPLLFVEDGVELLQYLRHEPPFDDPEEYQPLV